ETAAAGAAGEAAGRTELHAHAAPPAEPPVVFDAPSPVDTPPPPPSPPAPAASGALDRIVVTSAASGEADAGAAEQAPADASIALAPWRSDAPAARRLRQLPADQVYAHYLDERTRNASGTAFFLDVA